MGKLRQNNVTQCLSILEDFIGKAAGDDEQKGIAMLALHHLGAITGSGGVDTSTQQTATSPDPTCMSRPRADLTPMAD
jgi:hypothetical protein